MATLEKIRSKAGLLVGVVGIALLAFVIGDFLRSGSTFFQQSKEKVAIVDGEAVSIRDFQDKVEQMTEIYKRRMNSNSLDEEAQSQIRESVFNSMVSEIIMKEETKKIGMTVGKEELSDMIIGNNISPMIQQMPDFINQQTGAFDKNLLLQFLQSIESDDMSAYPAEMRAQLEGAKKYWLFWEQNIKQQKLETKFAGLLGNLMGVNTLDAKNAYEENKVSVGFDYLVQSYQSIPDDQVKVSESEIQSLYNERKEMFKQEAGKVVSYISVDIVPSKEDEAAVQKELADLKPEFEKPETDAASIVNENSDVKYVDAFSSLNHLPLQVRAFAENANINDVEGPVSVGNAYSMSKLIAKTTAPDSIKINQLLLPKLESNELKHITDSLIAVIKGGKSFQDMALEATNGQTNGDMSWVLESQLAASTGVKFKNEVFNAPVGEIFVAESNYGTHLVQVTEKTKPVTKYKVATIQIEVTPSSETYNKLYNDLNAYISKNNTLETFKSAAAEGGYIIQKEITLNENQTTLSNIPSSRPAIRWAFEHSKGNISEIFECQNHFVAMAVEGNIKAGYRPLASVSELLKRELLNDKKSEKIISDLKSKNINTFEGYASTIGTEPKSVDFVTFSTQNITGIGVEPIINVQAPLVEVGKIAGPMKGKNGVYVLNITKKEASETPYNEDAEKQSLQSANLYRMYSFMNVLRDQSKVEDNRIRFY